MDPVMQEIVDTHLIKKALYRYPRGIDRMDLDLLNSAYHDDALDYHGVFDRPASDFAKIAMKSQAKETCTSHMLGQSEIEFDGPDCTYVETYFFGTHLRNVKSRDNEPHILFMSGRYADRFDKRAGSGESASDASSRTGCTSPNWTTTASTLPRCSTSRRPTRTTTPMPVDPPPLLRTLPPTHDACGASAGVTSGTYLLGAISANFF